MIEIPYTFIVTCLINTGISVRKGKGRYRDTHIVTFAPRYLLDNRSTHKLAFAQREFARGKVRNELKNELFIDCLCCRAASTLYSDCTITSSFPIRIMNLVS